MLAFSGLKTERGGNAFSGLRGPRTENEQPKKYRGTRVMMVC